MKCRLKHNDIFRLPDNERVVITVGEMRKAFEKESKDILNREFERIKSDVVAQLMATVLTELNIEFGFGKDRLMRFKRGVESLFIAMVNGGIMGRPFDTDSCIKMMREKYGIDVEAKEV